MKMVCPELGLFSPLLSDYSVFYLFDFVFEVKPFLYQCFHDTFLPFDGFFEFMRRLYRQRRIMI